MLVAGHLGSSPPLKAIQAMAAVAKVQFADGSDANAAASLAASSQVAIVFVSQWESEGMDRPSLNLTDLTSTTAIDQDALVSAVAAANPHTIVVIESGGPIVMPWLGQVNAVLEAWYPGQSGGPAIADLLFGKANPSGKLPLTFPASVSQLPRPTIPAPPDNSTAFAVDYSEGFNVGYKWYDADSTLFPSDLACLTPRFRLQMPPSPIIWHPLTIQTFRSHARLQTRER